MGRLALDRPRAPLLGGPGFVDAISVAGMFAVVFALSIDDEVFLLQRIREGWSVTGTVAGAVDHGLSPTASVVTARPRSGRACSSPSASRTWPRCARSAPA